MARYTALPVMARQIKGIFAACVSFCQNICPHLRADTHHDNLTMQHTCWSRTVSYNAESCCLLRWKPQDCL